MGLSDIFIFMVVGFAICIVAVLFLFIGARVEDKLMDQAPMIQNVLGTGGNATEIISNSIGQVNASYQTFKWITVMLLVGMLISILMTGYLTTIKPVFFIPYIFIMIIAVIVAVPLSNTYETLSQEPTLTASFSGFFGQAYIFNHLPIWVVVIMSVSGMIMFVNMIRTRDNY